nr:hypothetical protein [Tanacetum cinerariifolium]
MSMQVLSSSIVGIHQNLSRHITNYGFDPSYKTWIHHGEPDFPLPLLVIDNTRQPQMSDMTACLNGLSYSPLNNEQNEPTQGDIGETSNEPTQAKHNEFEELYSSANKDLYLGCDYVTRLDFMTLLILGLKSPGKDIDVYLRPLIDDLKDLWAKPGVETIDVATGQKFNVRAMVLWTINDFLARSSLFGWSGQGYKACPTCNEDTPSIHLVIYLPLEALEGGPIRPDGFVLFRVKWFDTSNEGHKVKDLVLRNNMTKIWAKGESFKDDQYILATQVKQVFYLEVMVGRPPNWKVVKHVNHKKFSNGGVIVVEDDLDVMHFDNSSDLTLSTSLNDLDFATLHIDGQSTDVDAPPDIIDVDKDNDIINAEDALPHDLADFDDEDLVNVDDDDDMSADVARGHDGDGGDDDHPLLNQAKLQKIYNGNKSALKAQHWVPNPETGTYDVESIRKGCPAKISVTDWDAQIAFSDDPRTLSELFKIAKTGQEHDHMSTGIPEKMLRLHGLGSNTEMGVPYTEDEIMAIVRKGKQRGHLSGVGRVLSGQGTDASVRPRPRLDARTLSMSKSSKRLESQPEFDSGSRSGGCGDDESGNDENGGEDDEDADT